MCSRKKLLPKSLRIPLCYNRQGFPLYTGGFADVWKGEHRGQAVAVKVIRTPSSMDLQNLQMTIGVGCAIFPYVNALTEPCIEVLQGGCHVEIASTSECAVIDRSDNDRDPLRDGIRVDGGRKHQSVHEGTSRRRPVGACRFFIQYSIDFPSSSLTSLA